MAKNIQIEMTVTSDDLRRAARTIERIKVRATLHVDNDQEAPLSMVAVLLIINEAADLLERIERRE